MSRTGPPHPRLVALAVAALLLAALAPVAGASPPNAPVDPGGDDGRPGVGAAVTAPAADRCFPDDGTEFVIGTEGPQVRLTLHLSLFSAVLSGEAPAAATDATAATGTTAPATATSEGGTTDASAAARSVGAFGIEAEATTGTARVVSLRTGVLFAGVDDPGRFVADPFEPFAFAFDYRLTIPAFENTSADGDYRASDVPVEGPVEEAACSA
jgi:hypothetical protein